MATQRRSTALFEVINNGQRSGKTGALKTPKWWFKSSAVADPSISAAPAPVMAPPTSALATVTSSPAPKPLSTRYSRADGHPGVQFNFDRDRQQVTVSMHYTIAVVSAFGVLVCLGLAYAVGRHISGNTTPIYAAATTDQLMHMPADPGPLDVGPGRPLTGGSAPATTHLPQLGVSTDSGKIVPGNPPAAPPVSKGSMEVNQPRSVGLNYIIVQSYNTEKLANEARDFLVANNVPCTVEKISNFYTVISSAGFSHIHSTEFEGAIKNITALGEKFAGKTKFKRFDPYGYKWKATTSAAS